MRPNGEDPLALPSSPDAPRSWCEVSRAALTANVAVLRRRLAPGALLGVVVKANAYGHGLVGCSQTFLAAGADWLIVDAVEEAEALRAAGVEAPLYIVGWVAPWQARRAADARARVVVYDPEVVAALAAAGRALGRPVPVHVKVETGNHRQGLCVEDAVALGRVVAATEGVTLEGIATHYADIEDTTDHRFAHQQRATFEAASEAFRAAGLDASMRHSANSAATILWPETHGSLARVGIAAYGLWPSRETYATMLQQHASGGGGAAAAFTAELSPALTWRARIAQVKDVPVGAWVGYGRTYRTTHASRLAILPIGYHEGYDRRLSNLAHALVGGSRAPVRGRVCMNMTMIDVTHAAAVVAGDVATLLGGDGAERVSAEDLAGWMGTINYEVVSRIHPALPRVLV